MRYLEVSELYQKALRSFSLSDLDTVPVISSDRPGEGEIRRLAPDPLLLRRVHQSLEVLGLRVCVGAFFACVAVYGSASTVIRTVAES